MESEGKAAVDSGMALAGQLVLVSGATATALQCESMTLQAESISLWCEPTTLHALDL